jgi:hypothetical protein
MTPIPPTNAQLRVQFMPLRVWLALTLIGALLSPLRDALYGIPLFPLRLALIPLIVSFTAGAAYFIAVELWLLARRLTRR